MTWRPAESNWRYDVDREKILKAARACVCCDREDEHGDPRDNFLLVASLWESYLAAGCIAADAEICINTEDVAAMMMLLKIARIGTGRISMDNWIDCAGYAALGGELQSDDAWNTTILTIEEAAVDVLPGDILTVQHRGYSVSLICTPQGHFIGDLDLDGCTSIIFGETMDDATKHFYETVENFLDPEEGD